MVITNRPDQTQEASKCAVLRCISQLSGESQLARDTYLLHECKSMKSIICSPGVKYSV